MTWKTFLAYRIRFYLCDVMDEITTLLVTTTMTNNGEEFVWRTINNCLVICKVCFKCSILTLCMKEFDCNLLCPFCGLVSKSNSLKKIFQKIKNMQKEINFSFFSSNVRRIRYIFSNLINCYCKTTVHITICTWWSPNIDVRNSNWFLFYLYFVQIGSFKF